MFLSALYDDALVVLANFLALQVEEVLGVEFWVLGWCVYAYGNEFVVGQGLDVLENVPSFCCLVCLNGLGWNFEYAGFQIDFFEYFLSKSWWGGAEADHLDQAFALVERSLSDFGRTR